MFADKLGSYKLVLGVNILLTAATHSSLLAFPVVTKAKFNETEFNFTCKNNSQNYSLNFCENQNLTESMNIVKIQVHNS